MEKYTINPEKYINSEIVFCKKRGLNINLNDPKTIQEKLLWLNFYDQNTLKCLCADKIKIHDYCVKTLGEDICNPILKQFDDNINFEGLPEKFVLKCNHGSGMNIMVKNKDEMDEDSAKRQLKQWLSSDFTFRNGFEAHYHDIERKAFAEQFMDDGHSTLYDYKFWCFNGEPKFYTINDGNGHGKWMVFYDVKNNILPFKRKDFIGNPPYDILLPDTISLMFDYAKKLSKPFHFVRCDFYSIKDKVILGEMTFTPGAFIFSFSNPNDDIKIGDMLKLPI